MKKLRSMIALTLALLLTAGALWAVAEEEVIDEEVIDAQESVEEPAVEAAEAAGEFIPLEPGMTGEEVEALNARLTMLGYLGGELSEEYGEETEAAVRAFQLQAGLGETGIADIETQAALLAEDAPVNPDNPPAGEMVWIPKSGEKYHSKWDCGTMKAPTCVTVEEAEAQGYTPCSRCYESETDAEAETDVEIDTEAEAEAQ